MDDRELRQVNKMRQQIRAYQSGDIGLKPLIGDLMFLRDALSDVDKDWEHEFTIYLVDLESAYTYMSKNNKGQLEPISQKIVNAAIPELLRLVNKVSEPP